MLTFLFGLIVGGVSGAAIVLALAPNYQYQEDGEEDDVRAKVTELTGLVRTTVKEVVEEGKLGPATSRRGGQGSCGGEDRGIGGDGKEVPGPAEMVKKYQDRPEEEETKPSPSWPCRDDLRRPPEGEALLFLRPSRPCHAPVYFG